MTEPSDRVYIWLAFIAGLTVYPATILMVLQ